MRWIYADLPELRRSEQSDSAYRCRDRALREGAIVRAGLIHILPGPGPFFLASGTAESPQLRQQH
jgi:hypothetical protein